METDRLIMRRLRPDDYLAMAAWDMDERVYKYLMSPACKNPEDPLVWLPKKDPTSKINILMLVMAKEDGHAVGIYALNHEVERDVPNPHLHIHCRPRLKKPVVVGDNTYADTEFGHHYALKKEAVVTSEDRTVLFSRMKAYWEN